MSSTGATWRDEYELLCERCGYSIEGLPGEGVCPECAKPIVESLPAARVGSAWQQDRSLQAWISTNVAALRRPDHLVSSIEIETSRSMSLAAANLAVVTTILALVVGISGAFLWEELTGWIPDQFDMVLMVGTVLLVAGGPVLTVLTMIEYMGIQFFSRVHKTRITPTVACALVAHATAGWLVASILFASGFLVGLGMNHFALHNSVGPLRGTLMLAPVWIPTLVGLLGLLSFEMIVYAGVRECRFANRAKPEA